MPTTPYATDLTKNKRNGKETDMTLYDQMQHAIDSMNYMQVNRFLKLVLRGHCYSGNRPMSACIGMWAQAEHDARHKMLFKIASITDKMKRTKNNTEKVNLKKQITAMLREIEYEGCRAAEKERERQIAIFRDMGFVIHT